MRTRWFRVAGTVIAIVAFVGVVGPALVHTPVRAAVAVAEEPVDTTSAMPITTLSTIPPTVPTVPTVSTVPTLPVTEPATTIATMPAAVTSTSVTSPPVTATIGTRALALISYPWTTLGYTLTFHGPKAGFMGLTDCHTHNIDIYVTADQTVAQVAFVTAFEIGHAIDCSHLADGHQTTWPPLRGYQPGRSWFPSCTCSEDNFSSGDFSEVFARWQVGAAYPWRSALAPAPTAAQIAALIPQFG